jgi:hypothetical protein
MNIKHFLSDVFNKHGRRIYDKGYYILVNFKQVASYFCVGGMLVKQIEHHYDNELLSIEDYHPLKLKLYSDDNIPIIDLTTGRDLPSDCTNKPEAVLDNVDPILFELNE